jgi:hypothetical protein
VSSVSKNVEAFGDKATLTIWREQYADSAELVILMRVFPTAGQPFMCGGDFHILQGGLQFNVGLLQSTSSSSTFCGDVLIPTTLIVGNFAVGSVLVDKAQAFTLTFQGYTTTFTTYTIEIPAAGPAPPPPPSVLVVSTACNPCHSGQVVAFTMNITNPGPAVQAEIKGGARFPDGSILPLVNQVTTLPSGASVLALVPAQALPGGLPTIDLLIEAALLEPTLGVTLSRHNVTLHLLP